MTILVITCVRNEGPYLVEWLAHMRGLGVDHFLIYSNDCDDGTDTMLDVVADQGWLTHIRHSRKGDKTIQWQALKDAGKQSAYQSADWVLFADVDEFPALAAPHDTFHDLMGAMPEDCDAIAMPWRLFGNAGLVEYDDAPVTTRFTHAASPDIAFPAAHFFKTLYRRTAFREPGVHRPKAEKGATPIWVGPDSKALPPQFAAAGGRINTFGLKLGAPLVQLNHYSTRSAAEFLVKRQRGLPNRSDREVGLAYWVARNFNTVRDSSIARHAAGTSDLMVGDLADLHQAAVRWHRDAFDQAMRDEDTVRLFWLLQLTGSSSEPTSERATRHLQRLGAAKDG